MGPHSWIEAREDFIARSYGVTDADARFFQGLKT